MQSNQQFFGMSLEQRLNLSGKNSAFKQALARNDERGTANILRQIGYTQSAANAMTKTFFNAD